MSNQDVHKTIVIFRFCTWKEPHPMGWKPLAVRSRKRFTEVLALFPALDWNGKECASYAHIGQHSGADYQYCIRTSRPATPEEYAPLKAELERIGYNLDVRKRYLPGKVK